MFVLVVVVTVPSGATAVVVLVSLVLTTVPSGLVPFRSVVVVFKVLLNVPSVVVVVFVPATVEVVSSTGWVVTGSDLMYAISRTRSRVVICLVLSLCSSLS